MKAAIGVLLLASCVAAPPSDPSPGLSKRIDAEVRQISGFRNPTAVCGDGEFLRRVMLDLVGYPPNADDVRAFVTDPDPGKRAAKVDQLLATERHADFWARRWMEVFFGNYHEFRLEPLKSLPREDAARILESFLRWLKARLRADTPWDEIVRDLLEAEGRASDVPPLAYKLGTIGWPRRPYYENRASVHFLGIDLSCLGCHDHPFDKFRAEDGYSMMAFSTGRTVSTGTQGLEVKEEPESAARRQRIPGIGKKRLQQDQEVPPLFIRGGEPERNEVLARAFARLMTSPKNDQFRLSAVNRVWAWLFGRGIVNPVDDFNLKNKPLSSKLHKLVSDEFLLHRHSFRHLIRSLCATDAYQRRCEDGDPGTKLTFSRGVLRPLSAEQILNSLETATRGIPSFDLPGAQSLAERLVRGDAMACEVTEKTPDAPALLWLANGDRVRDLIRDCVVLHGIRKSGEDPVRGMFLAALSREPSEEEARRYGAFLEGRGPERLDEAYWSLLNSAEFLTRH
jgi:hypothetical protein